MSEYTRKFIPSDFIEDSVELLSSCSSVKDKDSKKSGGEDDVQDVDFEEVKD